ncbi:MAG TPA: membrane protein insertase YidC [Polyangia bacterium]|nr:membrane protein insertase YidC [Polyangia bacterium]
MEKRLIVAIALCVAFMLVWSKLVPQQHPAPAPAAPQNAPAAPASAPPPLPATATAPPAPGAGAANHPEQKVELDTPDVRFVFSSLGGTLVRAELRSAKFLDNPNDPSTGHDLVAFSDPRDAALRTDFADSGFPAPSDAAWQVRRVDAKTVVFATDTGTVHIEKRYIADATRYRLHLDVSITNRGGQPIDQHLKISLSGRQDPERRGGGFFAGSSANIASMLCFLNGKLDRKAIDKLGKDAFDAPTGARWIGSDEKFFLLAAVPYPLSPTVERGCAAKPGAESGTGTVTLTFGERRVPAQGTIDYPFAVYAGPKVITDLEAVQPGGEEVELDKAVDVSLAILSRPILSLLKFFHGFAHNWGLAIILLTVFIKAVTFYPTQKSLLSAKKMQKLAPKMNAIRKKYENDRQKQSVETMNLYKAHGVSPFGGCLPSLIQMPIWIALYSTLNYAVELYRAPFLHIHDLTAKDPFHLGPLPLPLTPLLMGVVMFVQMRMSPSGADQQQQKMMSVMMPVMFTAFSLFLPAGLAIYMLTSYLIGILQQLWVNHLDRKGTVTV